MVSRSKRLTWSLGLAFLLIASNSNAAIVTWSFEAEVRNANGDASLIQLLENSGFIEGLSISGSLSFDSTATDTDPTSDGGFYGGALLYFQAIAPGISIENDNSYNRVATNNGDSDQIDASDGVLIDGLSSIGAAFVLQLEDSTGQFLSSDAIPLGNYDLENFDSFSPMGGFFGTGFYIATSLDGNFATIEAELVEFQTTTIPLPAAFWFFGSALVALSWPSMFRQFGIAVASE